MSSLLSSSPPSPSWRSRRRRNRIRRRRCRRKRRRKVKLTFCLSNHQPPVAPSCRRCRSRRKFVSLANSARGDHILCLETVRNKVVRDTRSRQSRLDLELEKKGKSYLLKNLPCIFSAPPPPLFDCCIDLRHKHEDRGRQPEPFGHLFQLK